MCLTDSYVVQQIATDGAWMSTRAFMPRAKTRGPSSVRRARAAWIMPVYATGARGHSAAAARGQLGPALLARDDTVGGHTSGAGASYAFPDVGSKSAGGFTEFGGSAPAAEACPSIVPGAVHAVSTPCGRRVHGRARPGAAQGRGPRVGPRAYQASH